MQDGGETISGLAASSPQPASHEADQVLIGSSLLFQHVLNVADAVASNACVVLLEGESGTGKELLARRIHLHSQRSNKPFIPVNCSAISESLFESQFLGHVKGAFTGASSETLGMVRAADGGTLLLDEVGELPLHLQPKLLRLLQEKEVTPVGGVRPIPVDTRFIASTNRSLSKAVLDQTFRKDLYHRLNIVRIEIPPLRARPQDVDELLDFYLDHFAHQYRMPPRQLGDRLRAMLREYPWPGNVRELCAYVERLYAANIPPMPPTLHAWDDGYAQHSKSLELPASRMPTKDYSPVLVSLAQAQAQAINQALEATNYNRSAAAKILEIHRSTLIRKMRMLGMGE